jgi:hypothetical protein
VWPSTERQLLPGIWGPALRAALPVMPQAVELLWDTPEPYQSTIQVGCQLPLQRAAWLDRPLVVAGLG